MAKFQESLRIPNQESGSLCYVAIFILALMVFSAAFQAVSISNQAEEELNNKSIVCLK